MANKQLQVSLGFTADTAKAKAQIQDLQRQLTNLSKTTNLNLGTSQMNADIKSSLKSVDELRAHLDAAVNVKTGKLDLTKFNDSIKNSGKDLKAYRDDLLKLGPEGAKTFMSLGQSILNAEAPLKRTNKLMSDLWDNLKKTAGWQISSSAIHGLMGAMQSAYGYAEDLNASLNDIRIVTGQSVEQMDKFAKKANEAAKALSATTLDYTNAALIYYQQGLGDEEVLARTDVTVKMANVTKENAEDVSSYMTAIWNNFDDGSKSLEYYADVMTKLGAKTAASTEEIAAGLEKFAAIGETVGLSYEYATSAVATVVDKTRQSADTVGTSFKTIFSRLSSLSLGETLDDGVTLTKYSEALSTVGVQTLDANGNLREMDDILDDLGARWGTLETAEKNALAQTVAGVRQYNNLISLLDNYDAFKENVGAAETSSGELQKQADIYAESWEAARDRVQAALEDIYTSILDDDFFIGFLNFGADVLNLLDELIDGAGGLQGILLALANVMISFNKETMAQSLRDLSYNIKFYTGQLQEDAMKTKKQAAELMSTTQIADESNSYQALNSYLKDTGELQIKLLNVSEQITDTDKKRLQYALDRNKALHEATIELAKQADLISEEETKTTEQAKMSSVLAGETGFGYEFAKRKNNLRSQIQQLRNKKISTKEISDYYGGENLKDIFKGKSDNEIYDTFKSDKLIEAVKTFSYETGVAEDKAMEMARAMIKNIEITEKQAESMKRVEEHTADTKDLITALGTPVQDWANHVMTVADNFTTVASILTSVGSIWDTITDDSLSLGERMTRLLGTFGMLIPMVLKLVSAKNKEALINTLLIAQNTILAKQNKTNAELESIKANNEAIKEAGNLKGAFQGLLAALKPFAPQILATVAALAALAAIFLVVKYNSPEEKLKRANEELDKAQEAATKTTDAYDELKSSIDNLESAQETLSGLTEGTLEWKQAVLEVNQQVLDLIDKYPELAQYMTSNNGILSISEEGISQVLNSQLAQAEMMQQNALNRQREVIALEHEIERDKLNSANSNSITYTYTDISQRSLTGTGNTHTGQINQDQLSEIVEKAMAVEDGKGFNEDGTINFDAIGMKYQIEEFKTAVNGAVETIEKLKTSFGELDSELLAFDTQIAKSWLNTFKGDLDPAYSEYAASGMAKVGQDVRETYSKKIENQGRDSIIQAFAEVTGSTIEQVEKDITDKIYSLEDIKSSLVDNAVNTYAFEEINKLIESFEKDTGGDSVLKNIVTAGGDLSSYNALTADEVTKLVGEDGKSGLLSDSSVTEFFQKNSEIFGDGFVEKLREYLTQENYDEISQFNQDQKFNQKIGSTAQELGVDEEALKSYTEHLMETDDALKDNRDAALAAAKANIKFTQGARKVSEVLSDNEDILKKANKNSWEYHEALSELAEATSEMLGIEVDADYAEEYWQTIKKAINGNKDALDELQATAAGNWAENFTENLEPIQDTIKFIDGKEIEVNFDQTWKDQFQADVKGAAEYLSTLETPIDLDVNDANANQSLKNLVNSVNEAAAAGKMTSAEIESLFNSMGYSPEIKWETVKGPAETTWKETSLMLGDMPLTTFRTKTVTTPEIAVPQVKDKDANGTVSFTPISTSASQSSAPSTTKGSSGDGGSKSTKEKKSSSDEIERYHEITKVIEDLDDSLDDLEKSKDRAWGTEKLKLIEDEIDATERAIDAQEEYIKEIEKNLAIDKSAIAKYGAEFDANGNISNWEEMMNQQLAKYNKAVDAFNSGKMSEEAFEKAEKQYEEFKKLIEQYEETEQLYDDALDDKLEKEREKFDKRIELIETELDMEITMSEDTMEYLDYLLEKVERNTYKAADLLAIYSQQAAETIDQIESQSTAIYKELKLGGRTDLYDGLINGQVTREDLSNAGFTAEQIENIFNSLNEVLAGNSELLEYSQKVADAIIDEFNQYVEDMNDEVSTMEHLIDLTNSYRNIVDLTGQEALGITDKLLESVGQSIVEQNKNILASSKLQLDSAKQVREQILAEIEAAKKAREDTTSLELALEEVDAQIEESTSNFMSAWEEALQAAADLFTQAMENAIDRFGDSIAGAAGNMDNLQTLLERQQEADDRYLEDYAKIYELTKLNRDVNNSIDDTDNIKGKQALKEIQEEINALQEGNAEMSQYEVDQLRAKYELRLAEIALEEAQNAKSQVRMTRDSEGNWSYTYTADEDNMESAQQNYEDKLYALQELNSNYINEMSDGMAQLTQQMMDEIASLDQTLPEYQQRVTEITQYYTEKLAYYSDQMGIAMDNNQELYYEDWQDYSEKTGYKLSDTENFVMNFNQTMLGMATGFDTAQEYQQNFNNSIGAPGQEGTLLGDLTDAYSQWKLNTEEIFKEAEVPVDEYAEHFEDVVLGENGIVKTSDTGVEAVQNLADQIGIAFAEILKEAGIFSKEYSEYLQKATEGVYALSEAEQRKLEKEKEKEKEQKQENEKEKNDSPTTEAPKLSVGNAVSVKAGTKWYYDSQGNGPSGMAKAGTIKYTAPGAPYAYNIDGLGWIKKTDIVGYDTGGYTGRWGSSGKLGVLHEKELVLNENDTQNFLDGIMTLREITNLIDLKANMMSYESLLNSMTGVPTAGQDFNQTIEIYAEFPDAVYQDEIKAAFDTLVNQASQYANRKG